MKKLLNLKRLLVLTLLAIIVTACSNDDDNGNIIDTDETIADFVESNADFSMLNDALELTDLDDILDGNGAYTVFAPTNAAFSAYLGDSNLSDVDTAVLRQLLLNHVISNEATLSSNLSTGYVSTTATFSDSEEYISMYINTENTVSINGGSNVAGGANVTDTDNELNNGVVHVVDAVIELPTIATFASADANFSTLTTALTREEDFQYIETLSLPGDTNPAPFTVLAPTNEAFTALLDELNLENLDALDAETLEAALNLHVIAGMNVTETDLTTGPVTTLGGDVTIDANNGTVTDANDRLSTIVITDVQASNGVLHAIDRVLLPEMQLTQTIADFVAGNEDYSLLLAALQQTGLDEALAGDGNFTVFAPNNEAFETYLEGAPLSSVDNDELTQLLYNHVLDAVVLSGDLQTGYFSNLATFSDTDANISTYVSADEEAIVINGEATVTGANNELSNGVVHTVDAVIPMPTIITFATVDPNFDSLEAALTRDEGFDYINTLDTMNGMDPAPFTVFAPTNVAFEQLLIEEEFGGLDEIPSDLLQGALDLHVIAGTNVRIDDLESGNIETIGGTININAENNLIMDANNRTSVIIPENTDIQAANGVIHAIDAVILPELPE